MKNIFLSVLTITTLFSCSQREKGTYAINVTIDSVEDSTKVYLKKQKGRQYVNVDTTMVLGGTFSFEGKVEEPSTHAITIDKIRGGVGFILEDADIDITAYKDSLQSSTVEGGKENTAYSSFLEEYKEMQNKMKSAQEDYNKALKAKDTATIEALREEAKEIQEEMIDSQFNFAKDNNDVLVSGLILNGLLQQRAKPVDSIENVFKGLTEDLKNNSVFDQLKTNLEKAKESAEREKALDIGKPAPEFSGKNPEGETLALNDIKGKVTIIDFWGSWCKPCRAENPNVVKVYNQYKDKGLSIVGIALNDQHEKWVQAIEDDQLTWNHISDFGENKGTIAKMYNITAVPTTYILDENGVIAAKNLRGEALETKIAEMLN